VRNPKNAIEDSLNRHLFQVVILLLSTIERATLRLVDADGVRRAAWTFAAPSGQGPAADREAQIEAC